MSVFAETHTTSGWTKDLLIRWGFVERRLRKLETKDAGKPYAGKPHVRFDEGLETESETGSTARTHRTGGWEKTKSPSPCRDYLACADAKNTR